MAAGGSDTCASIRHAGSTAHERGPAGPVVAFCRGDRCVGSRVGMAAARGLALMGGALWERLARAFGRRARERGEGGRVLLEGGFGGGGAGGNFDPNGRGVRWGRGVISVV